MHKVQILLSVFNGSKYIKALLDSLLNQDYQKLKILVRDDGSNDGTKEILKHYSKKHGIKVLFEQNIGVIPRSGNSLNMSCASYGP